MTPEQLELIVLKPTPRFTAFITEQLTDCEQLEHTDIKADNTAFAIRRQATDEETLAEIEKQYPMMFRHEVAKRVGEDAVKHIDCSFLDFLCCFKFEMHSQIILMESDIKNANQIIRIKPRSVLLKWVKSSLQGRGGDKKAVDSLSLSQLTDDATVLMKNFSGRGDLKGFMKKYYRAILKAEMFRLFEQPSQWLDVDSYKSFSRYFTVDYHSQLVHLY